MEMATYVSSNAAGQPEPFMRLSPQDPQDLLPIYKFDHYIACPEEWFSKVLEKLYGKPVRL
jgi:hypothetical protein